MTGALHEMLLAEERKVRFVRAMEGVAQRMYEPSPLLRFFESAAGAQIEIEQPFGIDEPPMVVYEEVEPMSSADFHLMGDAVLDKLALRRTTEGEHDARHDPPDAATAGGSDDGPRDEPGVLPDPG